MFYGATVRASTAHSVVTRCMHPHEKNGLKFYTQRTHVQIFMFYDVAVYTTIITVTQLNLLETQSDCWKRTYM